MNDICSLSLGELTQNIKDRKIGVLEATRACLARMEEVEDKIGAMLTIDKENALKLAEEMDAAGPNPAKPLWGAPLTVKDALSTKNLRTTAASRILENYVPFYDAFAVQKLREAGAVILGKNNMDEFAMGSATENSAFKLTRNPRNLNKVPGGSSGGSAASVTALECFGSLGSDTGGSIRQPAAFCGCVGLKPTYGRVSRYGLFAFASSLDQIGPIARNVDDCALLLSVIAGFDRRDVTCADAPVPDYMEATRRNDETLAGVTIGWPESLLAKGISDEIREVFADVKGALKSLGVEIREIELPDPDVASATYYIIAMAEASSNLARYDGVRYGRRAAGVKTLDELYERSRSQGFGREVKRRVMLGSYVLSAGYYDAYFRKAAQTRKIIYDKYREVLDECDCVFMPAAPVTAWDIGSHNEDPLQAYLLDAFTLPANLAGLPGLSLPLGLGKDTGMPVGGQLIGKAFGEADILRAGKILENALPKIGFPAAI